MEHDQTKWSPEAYILMYPRSRLNLLPLHLLSVKSGPLELSIPFYECQQVDTQVNCSKCHLVEKHLVVHRAIDKDR